MKDKPSPLSQWRKLACLLKDRDLPLRPIIAKVGPPQLEFSTDRFRALVESILSQQLAPKAAQTIINRFTDLQKPFPKPGSILQWDIATLRGAGLSEQKASYVMALSEKWQSRRWRSGWESLEESALTARLTEVKGVGEWTAHMFQIFCLGRPDILPIGDYGVRRGVQILYKTKSLPLPKEMPALTQTWRGASSIAAWYVWQGLDKKLIRS